MGTEIASELPPRWRAVAIAAVAAALLSAITVRAYFMAENKWKAWEFEALPTVFPYLTAAVVFFAACVWVVLEGHSTLVAAIGRTRVWNRQWPAIVGAIVFTMLFAFLSWKGMSGPDALEAVRRVNCYLFVELLEDCSRLEQPCQIFNYVAAAGNATAIGTVVYIGMKCFELTTAAKDANERQVSLRSCARALSELLMLASTVLVTATLALYLLFVASAELAKNVPAAGKTAASTLSSPEVTHGGQQTTAADKTRKTTTIKCSTPITSEPFECVIVADPGAKVPTTIAPAMAFVAGLSFTGALFFLFMTAGAALDDVVESNMARARSSSPDPQSFNVKNWLEHEGLVEGTKDLVLRTLALAAPAATGAVTFLSG